MLLSIKILFTWIKSLFLFSRKKEEIIPVDKFKQKQKLNTKYKRALRNGKAHFATTKGFSIKS